MAARILPVFLFTASVLISGCGRLLIPAAFIDPPLTLQQQITAGGTISLPAGTVKIDCTNQLVITRSVALAGEGRDLTVLQDSCPTGSTISATLQNSEAVTIRDLKITHANGSDVHFSGNPAPLGVLRTPVPTFRLENVDLTGAENCLVSDGGNLLFVERSFIHNCSNDGAQIASFGVTFHDNWFGLNGRNGVTFTGAGFCAACTGNEYWVNGAHGLVYATTGIADPRHIGEYIDTNGDVGLVVNGVRDFVFNDGWIGSNKNGGATIGDTSLGTVLVGNTFVHNPLGSALIVTESSGPLRITGNTSADKQHPCDANINGKCFDLNGM